MKTILQLFLALTLISSSTKKQLNQDDVITVQAIFEGSNEENEFSFYYDIDNEGQTLFFKTISEEFLKKYDLKSDEFLDNEFEITYREDKDYNLTLLSINILE